METRIRILTADPNREFCRQLSELMAAEGDMEIIGMAADGLEALERVAELKPDLLLLSWCCRSWTGWRCCAACGTRGQAAV